LPERGSENIVLVLDDGGRRVAIDVAIAKRRDNNGLTRVESGRGRNPRPMEGSGHKFVVLHIMLCRIERPKPNAQIFPGIFILNHESPPQALPDTTEARLLGRWLSLNASFTIIVCMK